MSAQSANGGLNGRAPPFGQWERSVAARYLRAKRSQGGVALISVISFIGIMLAVAVLINFGVMGFLRIPLDIMTSPIAAMAVGIGSDYAVYFLFRLREELSVSRTVDLALASTMQTSGKAIKRGKLTMDPARHECTWEGRAVKLTVTEFLLLQALAQRPGFVKSRDNLMDAAYDDQVYVDDRTIDSHIKRMRKKFREVDPEFDAIETLYGVGYRYREA